MKATSEEARTAGAAPWRLAAVIEIGTTGVRMVLAEILGDGRSRVLESLQQAVSLGLDTFAGGNIRAEHVEECVQALTQYRRLIGEYGITDMSKVTAVATSAVREADNRDAVLDRIYIATGINVLCIDSAEVNRYTYMAVSQYLKQDSSLRRGDTMVIEVGGGSTEVLILRRGTVTSAHTYRLGSSRLLKLADQYSPVRDKMRDVMQGHADRVIKAIAEEMGRTRPGEMLLLGSDARVAAAAVVPEWNRTDLIRLPTSELGRLAGKALSRPVENVAESFGIPHSEAEVLGPALLLYSRFAEMLGVESVSVGAATLRDGIVRELAAGEEWTAGFRRQIIHSALTIGRKYRFDEKHAREVTRLAVFLFDRLRDEHGLGSRAEMILQVAGLLHDVGSFIGANGHHKHSMYLIANSDIFGLGSVDTKMAACIARYHRRAAPDAGHPEYMALDRENRIVVSKLAAILRLADAMDRSHAQRCRHLEVDLSPGLMTITVLRAGNIMVEQQGMREKSGMFEQVFGRKVILRD